MWTGIVSHGMVGCEIQDGQAHLQGDTVVNLPHRAGTVLLLCLALATAGCRTYRQLPTDDLRYLDGIEGIQTRQLMDVEGEPIRIGTETKLRFRLIGGRVIQETFKEIHLENFPREFIGLTHDDMEVGFLLDRIENVSVVETGGGPVLEGGLVVLGILATGALAFVAMWLIFDLIDHAFTGEGQYVG